MDNLAQLGFGISLLAAACAVALFGRRTPPSPPHTTYPSSQPSILLKLGEAVSSRPSNQLPIVTQPTVLLKMLGCEALETRVRESLGLKPELYQAHVRSVIDRFAVYVQLLPASESHHHANQGGLLTHLLECAAMASRLTGAYNLPKGVSTEYQRQFAAHWSVGITLCALLHDVGKPISNLAVSLYGDNTQTPLKQWTGLSGSMSSEAAATHYVVDFAYSDYSAHTRLPVLLLQSLVSEETRQWLEQEPSLMPAMMAYLSGESSKDDPIHGIVTQADQHSTATNLRNGPRTRFANAKSVPLIERMLGGIRAQLAQGELPMNRAGAAGWVDPDGESCWFVVGTLMDKTREWLDQNEQRQAGAAGLPKDNTRWLDTLQEYGALIESPAGGAVWHIDIQIMQDTGKAWMQRLSVVRFASSMVYAGVQARPAPLRGTITPVIQTNIMSADTADAAAQAASLSTPPTPSAPPAFREPPVLTDVVLLQEPQTDNPTNKISDAEASLAMLLSMSAAPAAWPEPSAPAPITATATESDVFLPARFSARAAMSAAPTAVDVLSQPPVQAADAQTNAGSDRALVPVVEHFIEWLKVGVASGHLSCNLKDSSLHVVAEGLGFMSPQIYHNFVQERADLSPLFVIEPSSASKKVIAPYSVVQKAVEKSGLLLLNDANSRLHKYTAKQGGKTMTMAILGAPQRFIYPLPPENKVLTRITGRVLTAQDAHDEP